MTSIFDYLFWRGDLSLAHSPFQEVDGVILARFSYLPFDMVLQPDSMDPIPIGEAAAALLAVPDMEELVLQKEDIRLLEVLAESPRFQHMKIFGYINQIETEAQTQFSAITIALQEDMYFLSFRGTDNTLVGWKEDLNMSFLCPVPAQALAVQYTEHICRQMKGSLILGGHSKGGNLAAYAAAFCNPETQERIRTVYNYDGPGFDEAVLLSEGYQKICGRIQTYVPQSSIVGMLLGHQEVYTIVHSTQTGILQHDIYSWEVQRDSFLCLETVDQGSRFMDSTLRAWIADLDYAQREKFVDTFYTILMETNVSTVKELSDHWFVHAKQMLLSVKNLDEPTRLAVRQALMLLVKSAKNSFQQMLQEV